MGGRRAKKERVALKGIRAQGGFFRMRSLDPRVVFCSGGFMVGKGTEGRYPDGV